MVKEEVKGPQWHLGARGGADRELSSLSGRIRVADSQARPSVVPILFHKYFHPIWITCASHSAGDKDE